jgi:hypothetical protein
MQSSVNEGEWEAAVEAEIVQTKGLAPLVAKNKKEKEKAKAKAKERADEKAKEKRKKKAQEKAQQGMEKDQGRKKKKSAEAAAVSELPAKIHQCLMGLNELISAGYYNFRSRWLQAKEEQAVPKGSPSPCAVRGQQFGCLLCDYQSAEG